MLCLSICSAAAFFKDVSVNFLLPESIFRHAFHELTKLPIFKGIYIIIIVREMLCGFSLLTLVFCYFGFDQHGPFLFVLGRYEIVIQAAELFAYSQV